MIATSRRDVTKMMVSKERLFQVGDHLEFRLCPPIGGISNTHYIQYWPLWLCGGNINSNLLGGFIAGIFNRNETTITTFISRWVETNRWDHWPIRRAYYNILGSFDIWKLTIFKFGISSKWMGDWYDSCDSCAGSSAEGIIWYTLW